MKDLTVRLIISNTGTATCETAKYLTTLLTQLTKSQYDIVNTDDLTQKIKIEKFPEGFETISCVVKSLLTNVPLD